MADLPIPFSPPMSQALREGRKTQTRRKLKLPTTTASGGPIYERPDMGGWEATTIGGAGCFRPGPGGSRIQVPETVGIWHRTVGVCMSAPYQVGDRLWVREEHYRFGHWEPIEGELTPGGRQKWAFVADSDEVLFDQPTKFRRARHPSDYATPFWHKRNARFMFRRHSRITLLVTDVRVQHLQDICQEDAEAEGVVLETADPPFWYVPGIWPHSITAVGVEERGANAILSFAKLWGHINGPDAWQANPWVSATSFTVTLNNIDQVT